MVVVGPCVVQVDVRVTVFVAAGVGLGAVVAVERGEELAVRATVAARVGAVVCRVLRAAGDDGRAGGVADADAEEVASGGGCELCTRTLPEPLLHAVTASMKQSPAANVPLLPMSA